ncbi:conserved Plasmodium protein, unknown function [Plasmodium gallinaceum]|uniref:PUB domain-containing protein n=1 Tax=Plasmodium gallinaceum TaxID=5849 RepID=A0A1J1GZJ7_PLAGA|nr:conserved Plasmodium protein, unknown function [Plasmodium gallinaceum]CRG97649.1 conserved Plasmodium protein, unknown function [Plasmodium gallinaceum]
MNFEKCVQFLKENFQNIEINKIEEEVNFYLIKKFETREDPNESNYEIDDNSLIELMEILSNLGNGKGDIANISEKRGNEEKIYNEYVLDNYDKIQNEKYSSCEYSNILNKGAQFNNDSQNDSLKDDSYDIIIENSNHEVNKEISNNEKEKNNHKTAETRNNNNSNINAVEINNNNNNVVLKGDNCENMTDIIFSDNINFQKKEDDNNKEGEKIKFINIKEKDNIIEPLQNEVVENNNSEKKNITFLEILFNKSLLENENIKKNIYAKNFYIVGEDMLINIILILDRIILQLIIYYKEKKLEMDEQNSHFQSFFKILYKLLSNIIFHSNEEKYRTIKLSNSQVKSSFLINADIFNLIKLLFEILNFNTNYSNNLNKEDYKKLDVEFVSSEYSNLIWKFEDTFNDKESILFEFVLSSIKIIMGMLNKNTVNKWNNIEKSESNNKTQMINKNENYSKLCTDQKKELEKLSNKTTPINSKLLQIHQKNKEGEQAINDIRKLHNERYKEHKVYENNENSDKYRNSSNKKIWASKEKDQYSKNNFFLNEETDEQKKLKSKKKIKQFFKKLFKKN